MGDSIWGPGKVRGRLMADAILPTLPASRAAKTLLAERANVTLRLSPF